MNLLLAFIIAMASTMLLIPLLMRWAGRMQVLDEPNSRKVHAAAVPRVGGIAIVLGAMLPLCLWVDLDRSVVAYLAAAALVFVFGIYDDRRELSAAAKFLGQLLAVFVVVYGGGLKIASYTLTDRIPLPEFVGVPLTVFFLLGATNAINLSDGLDGLAGGTSLLGLAAIGLLATSLGNADVATIAIVASGSILGFLRFNTYPARVFMGDAGSQFLGFTLAVLTLMLTQKADVVLSSALPVLLLGLPIVDTVMVILQRLREGRSPFSADKKHIHHKLLALGFDHHEAVAIIYGVQALFFLAAWFTRYEPDPVILTAFAALAGGVLTALFCAGRFDWRWRKEPPIAPASDSALARTIAWLVAPNRLPLWSLRVAVLCVPAYLLAVAFWTQAVSYDLAWLAAGVGAALVVGAVAARHSARYEWLVRGALYVAALVAVYLDHQDSTDSPLLRTAKWLILPFLVAAVAARMRLSPDRRFKLTALDVLLIFIALVVPNLPGVTGAPRDVGFSLGKLVALVYGIELCADQSRVAQTLLAVGALAFCAIVLIRAAI